MNLQERKSNKENPFNDPDMEMAVDLFARLLFDQILWEAKKKKEKSRDNRKEKVDQSLRNGESD